MNFIVLVAGGKESEFLEKKALKKLYCIYCQAEKNHVECKPYSHYSHEDFLLEYEYGNFSENGSRKQPYGDLKSELNKKGVLFDE